MSQHGQLRCRSCDAPIIFARTTKGARIPLDAEPNPAGNIELRQGIAHVVTGERDPDVQRYMPHHATCPNAADWRQR